MKKTNFLFITLVAALALITSGCSLTKKSEPTNSPAPVPPFLSQSADAVKMRTDSNLAIAKGKAAEWKNDAVLTAYNVKVPADLTSLDPEETFVFSSPQDTANWWTISVNQNGTYIRALIPREDYLGQSLSPVTESAWGITYLEALNTAEANGGLTFRADNPEAQISLVLQQSEPKNYLWWVINYQAANSSLKIRVSARDGGVYDEFGNPMSAGLPNDVPQESSMTDPVF